MLRAALACGDPVVYLEHKTLWGASGEVDVTQTATLGRARVLRVRALVLANRAADARTLAAEARAADPTLGDALDAALAPR
ncbi:MAG: alpha-ketoacid dehydrogenase subunit beta, partial [Deltaproteobacteria bacterium]|nr:alpha-ketoacid dehydrogenase subunit beta [Deltaproteobacteria bacterium]